MYGCQLNTNDNRGRGCRNGVLDGVPHTVTPWYGTVVDGNAVPSQQFLTGLGWDGPVGAVEAVWGLWDAHPVAHLRVRERYNI